jgi:hypothetical protein
LDIVEGEEEIRPISLQQALEDAQGRRTGGTCNSISKILVGPQMPLRGMDFFRPPSLVTSMGRFTSLIYHLQLLITRLLYRL